jgi:hypothetical protein
MAKKENSPLGNFLGFIGFFAGLAIGFNVSDGSFLTGLITGIIIAALGTFLGNVLWRLLVIAIAIIAAFISFNIRREVANVAIDVAKNSAKVSKEKRTETAEYYYVACITNSTTRDIVYQYRWDDETEWKELKLKSNYHDWRGHKIDQKLHIQFDNSFSPGYQLKEYYLLRKYANSGCAGGKKYEFYLDGGMIDLRLIN